MPPWYAQDLFPPKPTDSEFGWRSNGRSHSCTRDELADQCASSKRGYVELVWTPETERMVPPAEVAWLVPSLRRRARADLWHNLRVDVEMLLLGVAYLWYAMWWARRHGQAAALPSLYLAMFLIFVIVPSVQDAWALIRLRRSSGYLSDQASSLRYGVWLGGRRIVATYFVAAALVAVWAAQVVVGAHGSLFTIDTESAVEAAGLKPHNGSGGAWRLLTAEMLHGHWLHFGLNLLSLLAIGRLVEVHASPVYLPTVFLVSALTASIASLYLAPGTPSIGASGAIMGLVGFLAVLAYRRRQVLPRGFLKAISLSIALTAGAGLVAHQVVDNAAHFGGLIGGIAMGFVYLTRRSKIDRGAFRLAPSIPARLAGYLSAFILLCVAFLTIWLVLQARLQSIPPAT